jgi:phosphatidylglycerol:prolipoprotein diacylglycerol transferase
MIINADPHAFGLALLPWTTLLALAGGLGATAWMMHQATAFNLTPGATYTTALQVVLWSLLGGRFFHVIDYMGFYADVPLQVLYLWNGGLSLWGTLIFGSAGALWHAKRKGATLARFGQALSLAGLATLAAGRIGDFIAGERMGSETSLPWAVTYLHEHSVSLDSGSAHPVALYEALLALALLAALIGFRRRVKPTRTIEITFASYALGSFLIGFVTIADTAWGLDFSQWVSLGVLGGIGLFNIGGIRRQDGDVDYRGRPDWDRVRENRGGSW